MAEMAVILRGLDTSNDGDACMTCTKIRDSSQSRP